MSYAKQMLDAYPRSFELDADLLAAAIEAAMDCSQACTACADACLSEESVADLVKCIRIDLDCAGACDQAVKVLSRQTEYDANITRTAVEACRQACSSCADECERHASMHDHCRICAQACRRCEQACQQILAAIGA